MTVQAEHSRNQRAYQRMKNKIDQQYPPGHYVAIARGQIVADAPAFRQVIAALDAIERDPDRRLIVQAGVDYPTKAVDL